MDARTSSGKTALMWACQNGHREIVDLLLNMGAKWKMKDDDGLTALTIASENAHLDIENLLREYGAN